MYFKIDMKAKIYNCSIITLFIFLFSSLRINAQSYTVGVPVCDTIVSNDNYIANCSDDFLQIRLDSSLIPYVTGLNFQVEITAIHGSVLSNVSDTVRVGDIFALPAPNESGILTIYLPEIINSSFGFLVKLIGIPEVAGESYYCNIFWGITEALCRNELGLYAEVDQICTVQSSINSIGHVLDIPVEYELEQNYPNPFNPTTRISYSVPNSDYVTLKIYNILGNEIQALVSEIQKAGTYSINFNANKFTTGIYLYKLQVGNDFVKTKKMLLIR